METSWRALCRGDLLRVEDDCVQVSLETGRRQIVRVREHEDSYHLVSIVARGRVVGDLANPSLLAWQRNRTSAAVGFRVDDKGRMVADAWVPKAGLMAEEFEFYVITVAVEADRFEHQLTGKDVQ